MNNPWVGYITRSYEQIKDSIITKMQSLVPEITDHNESNLFVKMVGMWAGLIELLNYYIDNRARELNIMTCRLYRSAIYIAKLHDYRVKAGRSATANLLFEFDVPSSGPGGGSIPMGTEVVMSNGMKWITTQFVQIPFGEKTALAPAEEIKDIVVGAGLGFGTGQPNQSFVLGIPDYKDKSAIVYVNGIAWESKETLGYSNSLSNHFVQTLNEEKYPVFIFGDGINGAIPPNGQSITIDYQTTSGVAGNVLKNTITGTINNLPLPVGVSSVSVTNPEKASGGTDPEGLEQLRVNIPKANRTLLRAITEQDFIDIAELVNGVARAGVSFNCTKNIEVLIVPEGGGVASIQLCTDVHQEFAYKKPIGRYVGVIPAGELGFIYDIDVRVKPGYPNVITATKVKNAVMDITSYKNQKIGGTMQLSDVYQSIEAVDGVEYSDIKVMKSIPYAWPQPNTIPLNWTRSLKSGSTTTNKWRIVMASSGSFQLLKNDNYIGTYNVGVLVVQPEIDFTILVSPYLIGHQWEFYTYEYFGSVVMSEQSIPTTQLSDININAVGGV